VPQQQSRETRRVRRAEIQRESVAKVQLGRRTLPPLRITQRVLDRQFHVRWTQLRNHGAVAKLDQRMDHRLRVNDHIDLVRLQLEQPTGFDDFQGFIHHRRRVDGDFPAHFPGGMSQRVFDRDGFQLLLGVLAKRSTAGRKDDAFQFLAAARLQRLKHRAVLAVHGQNRRSPLGRHPHHQRPRHDQRFFVGQGQRFAGLYRRPGPGQARAAHDRGDHHVDLGVRHHPFHALRPQQQPRFPGQRAPIELPPAFLVGHRHPAGAQSLRLFQQPLATAVRGQADNLQIPVRRGCNLQSAAADTAGRTEDDDLTRRTAHGKKMTRGRRRIAGLWLPSSSSLSKIPYGRNCSTRRRELPQAYDQNSDGRSGRTRLGRGAVSSGCPPAALALWMHIRRCNLL